MSYEKINFKNREVEKPLTFKKHVNDDGTITLEPKPGTIVEPGTPLLADHFNHMEDGIYKAHKEIDNLKLSGIERNKELVANLNSKKVSATTNDSLKTNIAKVKDIKLGSGNAVTSDVLEGKTFSSSHGTDLTGVMPNHGSLSKTITTQGGKQIITPGYYSGGEVKAQFNNLTASNIKKGVNIGGVTGNLVVPFLELFDSAELIQIFNWKNLTLSKNQTNTSTGIDGKGITFHQYDMLFLIIKYEVFEQKIIRFGFGKEKDVNVWFRMEAEHTDKVNNSQIMFVHKVRDNTTSEYKAKELIIKNTSLQSPQSSVEFISLNSNINMSSRVNLPLTIMHGDASMNDVFIKNIEIQVYGLKSLSI